MISTNVLSEINSLREDDQAMILGLIKSLLKRNETKNAAQRKFDEICKKHKDSQMSMDEIDLLIREARAQ